MNFLIKLSDTSAKVLAKIYETILTAAPVFLTVFVLNSYPKWPSKFFFPKVEVVFVTILGVLLIDFLFHVFIKSKNRKRNILVFLGLLFLIGIIIFVLWLIHLTWIFAALIEFILNRNYLILLVLMILSSYLIQKKFWGRCILLFLIFTVLLGIGIKKLPIPLVINVIVILYCIDTLVQICQRSAYGKKVGAKSARSLLPFIFVLSMYCFFIPVKAEPYSWKKIINAYEKMEKWKDVLIYRLYTGVEENAGNFGMKAMGYGEDDGSIGGSVARYDIVMLDILTNKKIHNRMYLAGTTYETFHNNKWKVTNKKSVALEKDNSYQLNLLLNLYAFSQIDELNLNNQSIFHIVSADLIIRNMRTKSFFLPQDCISFNAILPEEQKITIAGNNIRCNEVIKKKQKYSVQYIEINQNSDLFQRSVLNAKNIMITQEGYEKLKAEVELWENSVLRTRLLDLMDIYSYKSLAQYAEEQKKEYLELPENTPQRMQELADELTAGYDTDYEKICSIQSYLKNNYVYSTTIRKEKGNPIDTFLFDTKSGYCTYFASSFTLLCRCAGIPARYVEGITYCKNMDNGEHKEITGKYAHAWTEVFVDGYGYLVVETTPGYEAKTNVSWPVACDNEQGYQVVNEEWKNNSNVSQYMNKKIIPVKFDEQAKKIMQRRQLKAQLMIGLVVLLISTVIILLFVRLISIWNYKHSNLSKQMSYQINEIMEKIYFLQFNKRKPESGRTVREILSNTDQIKWDQAEQVKIDLPYLCDLYDKSHYGSKEIQKKDIVYMEQINQLLKKKIRMNRRAKLRKRHV